MNISRGKNNPSVPPRDFESYAINYVDRMLASFIVVYRQGEPTDSEWDRVKNQVAGWRQSVTDLRSVEDSPYRPKMSSDEYWHGFLLTYHLDGDSNKIIVVESLLKWSNEGKKWEIIQTSYFTQRLLGQNHLPIMKFGDHPAMSWGDRPMHPREFSYDEILMIDFPPLNLDIQSYLTRPIPSESEVIKESEDSGRVLVITFHMGGVIEYIKFPGGLTKKDKQKIVDLLNEYNFSVREGYHRAIRMSPKVGASEVMDLEFRKWEIQRQVLIGKMGMINWHLTKDPQYVVFDARYPGEWNRATGEWNLGAVELYFEKRSSR